jgi:hypothetical protein
VILHHFTGVEYLDAIMEEGLSRGDVPTAEHASRNGVWFTTDCEPSGHGLSDGEMWPDGFRTANKRAIRIKVKIRSSDRHLVPWMKWGRKHCDPTLFERLNRSGGGKCETWFVYFGIITPDRFADVELLATEPPKIVIATLPDESELVVYGRGLVQVIRTTGRQIGYTIEHRSVASTEEAAALQNLLRPRTI